MKDIDFDELDQAVSSLLSQQDEPAADVATVTAVEESPEEIATSQTFVDEPEENSESTPESVPSEEASEELTTPATVAPGYIKRSKGRFMDVVHSSSDMRNPTKPAISHQGVTLAPVDSNVTVEETLTTDEPIEAADDTHTMPDPLDFQGFTGDVVEDSQHVDEEALEVAVDPEYHEALPVDESVVDDQTETAEVISEQNEDVASEQPKEEVETGEASVDVPFISGAAVDKRPLGAFSVVDGSDEVTPAPFSSTETPELPLEPLNPKEEDEPTSIEAPVAVDESPLPEELRRDIMAVESAEVSVPTSPPASVVAAAPVQAALERGSIAPQYSAAPPEQTTEATAIYDADAFRQAVPPAVKKRSGWLVVFLILLLVAIGVAAGVLFYVFNPLNLDL